MLSLSLNSKVQIRSANFDANSDNSGVRNTLHADFLGILEATNDYTELYLLDSDGIIVAQQNASDWEDGHTLGQDQGSEEYFSACEDNSFIITK